MIMKEYKENGVLVGMATLSTQTQVDDVDLYRYKKCFWLTWVWCGVFVCFIISGLPTERLSAYAK